MAKTPYPPNVVRAGIDYRIKEHASIKNPPVISKGYLGAITSLIEKSFATQKFLENKRENESEAERVQRCRRLVYGFLFGELDKPVDPINTAQLTPGQIYALYLWVKPTKDGDAWVSGRASERWQVELSWVFTEALFSHTQKRSLRDTIRQVTEQMAEIGDEALEYEYIVDAIQSLGARLTAVN